MKEIQMFPQITEETEENLLTLDEAECGCQPNNKQPLKEVTKSPNSSPLSSEYSSAVTSPVDGVLPEDENLLVPKIVAEYVDTNVQHQQKSNNVNSNGGSKFIASQDRNGIEAVNVDDEFSSPPPRVRMRSLSGGTSRLSPAPMVSGRMRRQSGDDVLSSTSSPRRAAFLDNFRPRSKSDSKGKKPTLLSTLKNSFFNSSHHDVASESKTSSSSSDSWSRSRSGSESKSGPMSKMMDIFRNRSNSISIDQRTKKASSTPGSAFKRRYSVDPSDRRRHPMITTHRSLELPLDHLHPLHQSLRKRSETFPEAEFEESPLIVPLFFESGRCDQVMPLSGKVVILGNNLKVDKAFFCLVENAMRAAPVWDSSKMEFIGMLTITDFIDVLLYYNSRQEEIVDFANQTISDWRNITGKIDKFICIDPNASLIEAVRLLVQEKVHRLPIFDEKTQSVLYTLTYKRILRHFLVWGLGTDRQIASIFPKPRFFSRSIRELQLGTFENIAVAHYDMTVIEALEIFQARRVSSLPVVENNLLVDVYAKFDVFALAKDNAYNNLNITIRQALRERNEYQEPLLTCTLDDTLQCILDRIVESEVHRVIIVKPKRIFVGIISLSDIIKFLALRNEADNGAAVEGAVGGAAEAIPLNDESHEILQQVDKPFGSGDSASASSGLKPPSDAQLSSQQALQAEIESIPFVESADEDEVFNKPLDASSNDPVTEGSSSEEEKTVEALEKLVIS